MRFVDTNVLLYAVSTDPRESARADRANALLKDRDLRLSVQVLEEFYLQATQQSRDDALTHDEAFGLVETFLRCPVQATTTARVLAATETRQRFGISYWDAAVLEATRP